jgi:hypothetical protein
MFAPLRDEGRLGRNFVSDTNSIQRNTNAETQQTFMSGEHKLAGKLNDTLK